jgi:hypothetical protein
MIAADRLDEPLPNALASTRRTSVTPNAAR